MGDEGREKGSGRLEGQSQECYLGAFIKLHAESLDMVCLQDANIDDDGGSLDKWGIVIHWHPPQDREFHGGAGYADHPVKAFSDELRMQHAVVEAVFPVGVGEDFADAE